MALDPPTPFGAYVINECSLMAFSDRFSLVINVLSLWDGGTIASITYEYKTIR